MDDRAPSETEDRRPPGSGVSEEEAAAARRAGEAARKRGDREAALRWYEEAVAGYREAGEPLRLAHTLRHLGLLHEEAGRSAPAAACFRKALELCRAYPEPPPLDLANAVRCVALIEEGEAAEPLWREAEGIYRRFGVAAGVAESAARRALLAHEQGDAAAAREHLARATTAAHEAGDPETEAFVETVRARL